MSNTIDLGHKAYVSGCDIDGIARGKLISAKKLVKSTQDQGFGFCSVVFGWDMHDAVYDPQPPLLADNSGFSDVMARVDQSSIRRMPWDDRVPFFIVDFHSPVTGEPLACCPRSLLRRIVASAASSGVSPKCGMELEFFNFRETPESLHCKAGVGLTPLTRGMFGYSLQRPAVNRKYFDDIFDCCRTFDVPIEGLHTETGPGVYEVAIEYTDALQLADRVHLFKMVTKQVALTHSVTPCFMAKPYASQPGCSGHIHVSLAALATNKPLFTASATSSMNDPLKHFIAGLLKGLPSIMAILAPTINSYKRLVENYWAPLTVSYGFDNRTTSLRIIAPPTCPPEATRIEVRVPGADVNPYLAVAAIIACGMHGLNQKLPLDILPQLGNDSGNAEPLPRSLQDATAKMMAPGSVARIVLGDAFVDHYGSTRLHECRIWNTAVTDWELKRYMETV